MIRRPPANALNSRTPAVDGTPADGCGILVLGMHRSGTSAIARVIAAMGAHAGGEDELLPAHPLDNPAGYFERTDVMLAHDRLLAESGAAWDHVSGFDPGRVGARARAGLARQIEATVASLHARGGAWLIKDPRLCLLLPLWLEQAPDAACVVAVRDPREIAASLVDTHRGIYPTHFLLALWEKYTRALLAALAGRRALFVSYATLMAEPVAGQRRLRDGLAALGASGLSEAPAGEALDRALQRSRAAAHAQLSAAQAQLFDWLAEQARAPGPVAVEGFPTAEMPDAVLAEYEHAIDDCARRARAGATAALEQHLEQIAVQLQQHERERAGWRGELAARRGHNEQLLHAIDEAQQGSARLQQAIAGVNTRAARLQEQLDGEREHAREAAAALAQSKAELDRAHASLEGAQAERDALDVENQSLRTAAASAERQRDALAASLEQATRERDEFRALSERAAAELVTHGHHAVALSASVQELQSSWSWRMTAPLRLIGRALRYPSWSRAEPWLYRLYYAIPGIDVARKRRLIVWLHAHLPWLTGGTHSYALFARARATVGGGANPAQRMDETRAAALLARIGTATRFAIVMVADDVEPGRLTGAVTSVLRQFYPQWELHIAVSGAVAPPLQAALSELAQHDLRIRVRPTRRAPDAAGVLNSAVRAGKGDYVVLLDADCDLARDALLEFAQAIAAGAPDLIYCDEDAVSREGRHTAPAFKPDFSLDYLFSANFIGGCCAVRRALLQSLGGFRAGYDGAERYDMLLRVSESSTRIAHCAKVLLHRHGGDAARSVPERGTSAALQVLRESLARRGIDAEVAPGRLAGTWRVRRRIAGSPLVSILLPFRDKPELLRTCVHSLLEKTRYANFELVGIDNGSVGEDTHALMRELAARDTRVRFVRHDVPFNYSAIVNFGVTQTRGEHLLMLNNDTEVISEEWIEALLEHSQRPEVGAVGALLEYPNRSIQHAGVIVGLGGVAGHAHLMLPSAHGGYCGRAQVIQNLSAVTFACAMTRRDVFDRLGGLDSVHLTAAYNDIDYCLRLREAGYLIVYTPYAELYHHESASRPHDLHPAQRARYDGEIRYMKERHAGILTRGDPYYSPHLSLAEGFVPLLEYAETLPA